MGYLFLSFLILLCSAVFSLFLRRPHLKMGAACGGVLVGSILGCVPAIDVLMTGVSVGSSLGSPLPSLTVTVGIDSLSAFFLVAILGLSGLIAIYAMGYLRGQNHLIGSLPFFPLLVATMAAVVTARDGFLFLVVWEIMSLSSFFLVTSEHALREVRHAGWIYLIATHLATAFLLAFFVLLFQHTGSFSFEDLSRLGRVSGPLASVLFCFAVVGFGTKAGLFPFHIWLPHAHPAAPSYISALMSGVMIKTGIYGILRALTFLGSPPPLWWGEFLIGLGILSAVLGVLYALMQHDLKRLLAYHSVENIGIIVVGIGLGLMGLTLSQPILIVLGFGGGLLHVWNHAIFKGLLFLGAGNVVHAAHTRDIDQLGGLFKKMPFTGTTFLIASAAICGLPPLNGFISEWLIYLGLFKGLRHLVASPLFFSIAGIIGIAFAGGLAVACFTKVIGVVFLGEPRSENAVISCEVPKVLFVPMGVLAFLCILFGLTPQLIWPAVFSTVQMMGSQGLLTGENGILDPLSQVSRFFWMGLLIFGLIFGLVSLMGRGLFGKRPIRHAVTWDCGYVSPTSRMQYTASSFAESLGLFFSSLLKPHSPFKKLSGLFPQKTSYFSGHTEDWVEMRFFKPIFRSIAGTFLLLKKVQGGRIQWSLTLIFATLILLLLWEVWFGI